MKLLDKHKRPVFLGLIVILGACASIEPFKQQMNGFIGQPISRIQAYYGYNFIKRQLENDQTAYTWTWSQTDVTPGHQTPTIIRTYQSDQGSRTVVFPGTWFPPTHYQYACEFTFITDSDERAIAWRAHGDGCAHYPGPGTVMRSKPK